MGAQANQQQVSSANQGLVNAQQSARLDASQPDAVVAAAQKSVDADNAALAAAQSQPVPAPKPANGVDPVSAAQNQLARDQQILTQAQNHESSTQLKDKQQVATAASALSSPVAGTITAVSARDGGRIDRRLRLRRLGLRGLVTMSDTGHLQVVAGFSESDIANMKPGQTAQFTFPARNQDAGVPVIAGSTRSGDPTSR